MPLLPVLRHAALALLLVAPGHVIAKTPAPAKSLAPEQAMAPISSVIDAKPALWVVKDADTTIYLFGTIHLLKPEVRWFGGPIRTAFDSAQQVVLEVVDNQDGSAQASLLDRAMTPDGPPTSSKLAEPARAKYLAALAANGLPPETFDKMKPWFAMLSLSVLPLRAAGYDPASGVDHKIEQQASAAGKTLTGLETSSQQIGFFENMPEALQISLLNETVDELPKLRDTIERMIGAWAAGDPARLADIMNESVDSDPELERLLLTDRNAHWADWIKARLDKPGTVFLAVGAGHLAGKGSVQDMLARRGLKASRVKPIR